MNSDLKILTDEELLAIAKAATPGPWIEIETETSVSYDVDGESEDGERPPYLVGWCDIGTADGELPVAIYPGFRNDADGSITPNDENIAFSTTFHPAFVTSLIERAQVAEARARTAEEALKKTSGALQMACSLKAGVRLDDKIVFTGEFTNLGAPTIRVILDEADRALSTTNTESDQTLSDNSKKEA